MERWVIVTQVTERSVGDTWWTDLPIPFIATKKETSLFLALFVKETILTAEYVHEKILAPLLTHCSNKCFRGAQWLANRGDLGECTEHRQMS